MRNIQNKKNNKHVKNGSNYNLKIKHIQHPTVSWTWAMANVG